MDILKTEERLYVSTQWCELDSAAEYMDHVNSLSISLSDTVAYHAVQSFKRGEVSPDVAHKIGKELAKKLWGDFPVVIARSEERRVGKECQ